MGRYNFAPQNVHKHATQLLSAKQLRVPPPWYDVVGKLPPSTRLVRPPMRRPRSPGRKASSLFKPAEVTFAEDKLRWEYFNDHPWELARPRVIVEEDGRDHEKWKWSLPLDYSLNRPEEGQERLEWETELETQSGRPINGEAVVRRQAWLIEHRRMSQSEAYDVARKEYYRFRHAREVEARVAREEALAVGAQFGLGPLEVGMKLEDQQYEDWKTWAIQESQALKQLQQSAYSGAELEDEMEHEAFDTTAPPSQLASRGQPML